MEDIFNFQNKKFTWKSIVFLIGSVVALMILQIFHKNPTLDNTMVQVSDLINRSCPYMLDSVTRLEHTAPLPNNTFGYNYTILNAHKMNFDSSALINHNKKYFLNVIKTDPKYKLFRDKNTSFSFSYYDTKGSYLFNISLTPNDYK